MNRTQRGAWFNLMMMLFCCALCIYPAVKIFVFRRLPEGSGRFWPPLIFWLFIGLGIFFVRKKQSPAEVDSDERDTFIKKRAVLIAFVSVWVVLLASSIILRMILGPDGSVPVWTLPILNLGVFFAVMLIHEMTVLIQYGRGAKGETS